MALDEKYERFAQLLFALKPAHEAYLEVGYPRGKSYKANARRLASHPQVKARVKELQSQAAACMVIDAAWLRDKVAKMAGFEIKPRNAAEVISAMALLAKMLPEALVPQKVAPTNPEGDGPAIIEIVKFVPDANPLQRMAPEAPSTELVDVSPGRRQAGD